MSAVDFASVPDAQDANLLSVVVDFIYDAVIAHASPPVVLPAGQFLCARWTRGFFEQLQPFNDCLENERRQLSEIALGTTLD